MIKKNKKIYLRKKSKVYILAPANTFTGGPECLHQLAFHISKIFKVETLIYYVPNDLNNPIHKNFKHYNIKFTNVIEDQKENILIMPEAYSFLNLGLNYSKIQKIIWWLSIDNYLGYKFKYQNTKLIRSIVKIPFNLISIFNKITNFYFGVFTYQDYLKIIYKYTSLNQRKEISQASLHLMQSYYAYEYLKNKIQNLKLLYDYQNKKLLKSSKKKNKKENIICYSNKSNEFIQLLKSSNDKKFIELKGFTSKQIIEIFKKSKVYIDFGYHPGKDKMPREATLFNNCIITNQKGSAKNKFDIPINKNFKFKQKYDDLKKINYTIDKILKNHSNEIKKFNSYKIKILNEEKNFKRQLMNIFCKKKINLVPSHGLEPRTY